MCSDGEVHKWVLDKDGRHLEKQEFIRARGSDNPFMIMLDYDDMKAVREEIKNHYGCNIYGWVNVSRVAGNLHFAVRQEAVLAAEDDITTMDALLRRHAELFGAASPVGYLCEYSCMISMYNCEMVDDSVRLLTQQYSIGVRKF